jgi:sensor histidine kinase YesM
MIIVGIIIAFILHTIQLADESSTGGKYSFAMSIFLTFLIWEGNLLLDKQFAKKFPWTVSPFKRIFFQVTTNLIYSASLIYGAMQLYDKYVCIVPVPTQEKFLSISIIIGTLVSLLLLTVEFGTQFFRQWKLSLIEVERYKKESIEAQLEVLKGQINPHFLFNNLSVLSSLVYIDQDKAVEFINQFSKVYRYVLDCNDKELTSLDAELEFIKSYIFLLQIRFGNNIKFVLHIHPQYNLSMLPPMALELLVENTIKHNEVSNENPLVVEINTHTPNYLTISNNLQARKDVETGSKLGLQNIIKRYQHYTNVPVIVEKSIEKFVVQIPLLPKI